MCNRTVHMQGFWNNGNSCFYFLECTGFCLESSQGFVHVAPSLWKLMESNSLVILHLLDCIQLKPVWFHVFVLIMSLLLLSVVQSSYFLIWLFQLIFYLVFSCAFLLAGFITAAEIHNLWFLWQDQGWVSIPPSTIPQVQAETLTCTLAHKHKFKGEMATYPSLCSSL